MHVSIQIFKKIKDSVFIIFITSCIDSSST